MLPVRAGLGVVFIDLARFSAVRVELSRLSRTRFREFGFGFGGWFVEKRVVGEELAVVSSGLLSSLAPSYCGNRGGSPVSADDDGGASMGSKPKSKFGSSMTWSTGSLNGLFMAAAREKHRRQGQGCG